MDEKHFENGGAGLKINSVLAGLSGQFSWILSGPSQNEVALDFLQFKGKNLNKRPIAFNGALTKRKEQKGDASSNAMRHQFFFNISAIHLAL